MARTTPWEKTRSCFFLFFRAKSTKWPNSTRSATDALLALSILIGIAQFGLCSALAHDLLFSSDKVECWNVRGTGDADSSGFVLGSSPSDVVLQTEIKSLPLTYANLNKTLNVGGAQENGARLSGPEYLSAGAIGGVFTIAVILSINPFLLVVDLFIMSLSHSRSPRISNRAAMLWSTSLVIGSILIPLGVVWLDSFPSSKIDSSYDTCWQQDDAMDALEGWGRWARSIMRANEVLGVLGALCMAAYFGFALAAAYMNQRADAQQPTRLEDLRRPSSTPRSDNHRDLPSSGLGTRSGTRSGTRPGTVRMNNFGLTFIDGTRGSDRQYRNDGRQQRPLEDQGVQTNPFADPEDPEDPYRGGERSQESVVQEPEVGQGR